MSKRNGAAPRVERRIQLKGRGYILSYYPALHGIKVRQDVERERASDASKDEIGQPLDLEAFMDSMVGVYALDGEKRVPLDSPAAVNHFTEDWQTLEALRNEQLKFNQIETDKTQENGKRSIWAEAGMELAMTHFSAYAKKVNKDNVGVKENGND